MSLNAQSLVTNSAERKAALEISSARLILNARYFPRRIENDKYVAEEAQAHGLRVTFMSCSSFTTFRLLISLPTPWQWHQCSNTGGSKYACLLIAEQASPDQIIKGHTQNDHWVSISRAQEGAEQELQMPHGH